MFHWQECDNLAGYGPDRTWQAAGASGPAVLFNACNVGQGSRLVIGFPPLPIDVFPRPKTADDKSSSEPAEQLTRSPPAELFHLYSGLDGSQFHPRISLTKAVRLSSNFPWGFYSSVIQDPSNPRSASYTPSATYVLDGGVVDNTGIDAIHDLFDGLRQTTSGHRLLNLLARRRVVLLEIDSGAKPSRRSPLQGIFPGLLEPAQQALGNAAYTNADRTKRFYLEHLKELLGDVSVRRSRHPAAVDKLAEDSADFAKSPGTVYTLCVECNHFSPGNPDQSEVMTAWALSPLEESSVIARFCYELSKLEADLADIEKDRQTVVRGQAIADALRPGEALRRQLETARAQKDLSTQLARAVTLNDLSAGGLQQASYALDRAEKHLDRSEQIIAAAKSGNVPVADFGDFEKNLQTWRNDVDAGQRAVEAKAQRIKVNLKKLPQASAEPKTEQLMKALGSTLPPENEADLKQELWQSKLQLGNTQELIDRRAKQSHDWFSSD